MEECFKCHVSETKAILFDVILPSGISKICGKCSTTEQRPIFSNDPNLRSPSREDPGVKERLERISGVKGNKLIEKRNLEEVDSHLKKIVRDNFARTFVPNQELKGKLIDNFHWIVMRARRMKHLSQEKLAMDIKEPLELVKAVEAGNAPEKEETIKKIEDVLNIRIRKDYSEEHKNYEREWGSGFDSSNLTIYDLQKMNEEEDENSKQ